MSHDLLIGCPVRGREWILQEWFDHVYEACERSEITPRFVFVAPKRDIETKKVIQKQQFDITIVETAEYQGKDEAIVEHQWTANRLHQMVDIRNILLTEVREQKPEMFLSLDSDILIRPTLILDLVETLKTHPRKFSAVGGKAYMSPSGRVPSYMMLGPRGKQRKDSEGIFQVDVIMAIKLMGPAAYAVDYDYHHDGEDVGWSINCKKQGLRLGWNGMLPNKHIMNPRMLVEFDKRVGY